MSKSIKELGVQLVEFYYRFFTNNKFIHCWMKIKTHVRGHNNTINVGIKSSLRKPIVKIVGSHNSVVFGEGCSVAKHCSFWIVGNNCKIEIGNKCSFNHHVHVFVQEDNTSIVIGDNCMFANNIIVRTSDSHPIFDINTKKRINPAKNIIIGNHVWIAPWARILKGVTINQGAIVASNAVVTKNVPENSIVAGVPASVVKKDVLWNHNF